MKTILVVDDKANVRRLLKEYLMEQQFKVFTAENGRDALFVARENRPDLILLDIMMPQMDGYQFLRHYRREAETPVIIITARKMRQMLLLVWSWVQMITLLSPFV